MPRHLAPFTLVLLLICAVPASAQSLGTFRWQLQPFGSVLVLNVTQQGSVYVLNGFESQCSNPSLPAWGVAVPQGNGNVLIGVTTITQSGNGLHTRAQISASTFSGAWIDNANSSGTFAFNPGNTCPGGPRIGPLEPDPTVGGWPEPAIDASTLQALLAEIESMRKRLADLELKKP